MEKKVNRKGKKRGPKGASRYTEKFVNALADKLLVYAETNEIPFLKDFAYKNRVPAEEISRTCAKNPKFAQALSIFKDRQESQLVQGALANKINCTMAIFALKNVAGWRDRNDIDIGGKKDNPININIYKPSDENPNQEDNKYGL